MRWLLSLTLIFSVACSCVQAQDRTSSLPPSKSPSPSQSSSPSQTGKAGSALTKTASVGHPEVQTPHAPDTTLVVDEKAQAGASQTLNPLPPSNGSGGQSPKGDPSAQVDELAVGPVLPLAVPSATPSAAPGIIPNADSLALPPPEPKRILGIMPNFPAVSAGTTPPPPTLKESFVIATKNSFDYSSLAFTGITSLLAEATDKHPTFGKGVGGFGDYYWHGFVDKTDGNYLVLFALPAIFHQDERYYALGRGSFLKRLGYAVTRVVVTPNYDGQPGFNASEILGRGIAQGISLAYYPSETRTVGGISSKYGFAIGRDALTNVLREFWPDISARLFHRHG